MNRYKAALLVFGLLGLTSLTLQRALNDHRLHQTWAPRCVVALQKSRALLDREDTALSEDDRKYLREEWRSAIAETHCEKLAYEQLSKDPGRCGIGFDWVAHELFFKTAAGSEKGTLRPLTALLENPQGLCRSRSLLHASFLRHTSLGIVRAAESLLSESSPEAWLAYGSLGEVATVQGDLSLAARIEARVSRALAHAPSREGRSFYLSVAGNAGCKQCLPEILKDFGAEDFDLRFAATHALRFVETPESVERLCGAALSDRSTAVRDIAAWALRWRASALETRTECLLTVAATDPKLQVRKQAALSLVQLASDQGAYPTEALIHLTGPDQDAAVRRIALTFLETHPVPALSEDSSPVAFRP